MTGSRLSCTLLISSDQSFVPPVTSCKTVVALQTPGSVCVSVGGGGGIWGRHQRLGPCSEFQWLIPYTDWEGNAHSMAVQRGQNAHFCAQSVKGISLFLKPVNAFFCLFSIVDSLRC